MTKILLTTLLATCVAFTTNIYAAMPADLTYAGKPIDSLCFYNPENTTQTINLKNCGIKKEKYAIKGENTDLIKKGFIGYNWHDPNISSEIEGYSYYQFFPIQDKKYWLYTINSGGGSGEFTAIYLATRKDENTLTIKGIAGGDRCNGGVQDVSEKDQQLTFSVNITPYDLTQLTDKKLTHLKAYDDLAACAACCLAKAFYSINLKHITPQFMHVDLGKPMDPNEMPEQGKYGECFNKLLTSYSNMDGTILSQEKINAFVTEFQQTCIKG